MNSLIELSSVVLNEFDILAIVLRKTREWGSVEFENSQWSEYLGEKDKKSRGWKKFHKDKIFNSIKSIYQN